MSQIYGYLLIVFAWILFGIIHSFMASNRIKEKVYQSGISPLTYRRIYNAIAITLFLIVLLGGGFISSEYFMPHGKSSQVVGLIVATFGFFLTKMAFKEVSFSSFIGWKEEKEHNLIKTGIYARIRHPLYTATILFLIGFVIFSPSYTNLLHAICLFIYLVIGLRFEEKRLTSQFGNEYVEYKDKVPMLLPRINFNK